MSTHGDDRRPCAGLWNTPMVYVNGDLTNCCLYQHLENKLGNLNDKDFGSLWYGEEIHSWRVAHADDRYDESGAFCGKCNWKSAGAMPHEKVCAYLEKNGEDEALHRYEKRWKLGDS